jgi:3-methyl-2-oxobutanoate hydroxymethyltransferase
VLVLHDVLGLSELRLKFAKHFADLRTAAIAAAEAYVSEVKQGVWPDDEHSFH